MTYPIAYRETQAEQRRVVEWAEAGLQVPGLEPERRARIEEILEAASNRICTAKPHGFKKLAEFRRISREELAWLKEDLRITGLRR